MEEAIQNRSKPFATAKPAKRLTVIPAPSVLPWDQVPREPHLLDYLIILRKHQWLILTFLLTVVTVVTIASFKMKPVMRRPRAWKSIKKRKPCSPFPDSNAYDEYEDSETYIETQTKILQSETLALMTIKSMDLARYPEFGGNYRLHRLAARRRRSARRPAILGAFLGRLERQARSQ